MTGTLSDNSVPEINSTSIVFSNISNVKTSDAEYLCIYELQKKLKRTGEHFTIGATCSDDRKPELWFFFTTTICAADSHLLNLFVCLINVGSVEISVPTKFDLSCPKPVISDTEMSEYRFHAVQPKDHHYIKTYSFRLSDLESSNSITKHYLPISLETGLSRRPNPEIVKIIKLEHNIGGLIRKEKPDFTLISSSGRQFDCHRIVLLAHSADLREQLREPSLQSLSLDVNDEEMEILLNFLYTGTVENMAKQDVSQLLNLSRKFDLSNLFALALTMYAPSRPVVEEQKEHKDIN